MSTNKPKCGDLDYIHFLIAAQEESGCYFKHLLFCVRAFLRLEVSRLRAGVSWYEAKLSII
ncbi:MAG: hypothetical protein ACUVTP_09000 [Candidatus Fervidibacter sp.]|uniref:hypothetical protein n=1 Tax=Candidatus Fervidibacter sp. TaxID=3100871 RepID=UPI00404984CC